MICRPSGQSPTFSYFSRTCKETVNFIKDYEQHFYEGNLSICLVTRPETLEELNLTLAAEGFLPDEIGPRDLVGFHVQEIQPNNIERILKTKDAAAFKDEVLQADRKSAWQECYEELEHSGSVKGTDDFAKKIAGIFERLSGQYLVQIGNSINQRLSKARYFVVDLQRTRAWCTSYDAQSVFAEFFNQNTRATIDARINAMRSLKIFQILRRLKSEEPSRMLQYTFLRGRAYKYSKPHSGRSRYEKIQRGDVVPNLFWYDLERARNNYRWSGLAGLRFLQCLVHNPHWCAGQTIEILSKHFGYETRVMTEIAEAFFAFGIVDIDPWVAPDQNWTSADKELNDYNCKLVVTNKGFIISQLAVYDPVFLYFQGLDTPMRRTDVHQFERKNHHVALELVGGVVRPFQDAQLVNTCIMLRYLITANRREVEALSQSEYDGTCFLDQDHAVSVFDLSQVLDDACEAVDEEVVDRCLTGSRKHYGQDAESFIDDFIERFRRWVSGDFTDDEREAV